jgi:hypothetical protein
MRLETGALERWRKGDRSGSLEISTSAIPYFDPDTSARLDGFAELKNLHDGILGEIHFSVLKFINPHFLVFEDSAVLFYQFFSMTLNPDGTIRSRTPWNCTEVYANKAEAWTIVHSRGSYINGQREGGGI